MEFLDLPEGADENTVAERYKEKFNFFKTLHTNAPNNIVRNIQQKNLEKLAEINQLLHINFNTGHKGKKNGRFDPKKPLRPRQEAETRDDGSEQSKILAWLVVHTENKPVQSYPLHEGENAIGRREVPNRHSIILDPDDRFVSRFHCVFILGYSRGEMSAAVADDGRYQDGKASANGTYVNGSEARITITRLRENDTVQIGETKLVFRWNTSSKNQIEDEVQQAEYVKTVVIEI